MTEFITVRKSDPQYNKYIGGEVEPGTIAIPVESSHFGEDDKVTFQLVKNEDIERPAFFKVWMRLCRFELLSLTLTPAAAVWAMLHPGMESAILGALAILSLFFLHASVMGLNDVNDHYSGIDRLNEKGGSRVLQWGWISASKLKRLSLVHLALGILFALPIIYLRPQLVGLIFVAAILAFIGGMHARWGYNKIFLSTEAAIFLCLGPLMAWGMEWVLTEQFSLRAFWIGSEFGLIAVAYTVARHLVSILVDDNSRLKTLPVKLGFDRAKLAVGIILVSAVVLPAVEIGIVMAVPAVLAIFLFRKMRKVRSPLASELLEMPNMILLLHLIVGISIVISRF